MRRAKKIDSAFEYEAALWKRQCCQHPPPHPHRILALHKKRKTNLRCRFKKAPNRFQSDGNILGCFFCFLYQGTSNLLLSHEACLHFRLNLGSYDSFELSEARCKNKWNGGLTKFSGPIFKTLSFLTISSKSETPGAQGTCVISELVCLCSCDFLQFPEYRLERKKNPREKTQTLCISLQVSREAERIIACLNNKPIGGLSQEPAASAP